jgi:tetratricopeptide (TPR) repeat protein
MMDIKISPITEMLISKLTKDIEQSEKNIKDLENRGKDIIPTRYSVLANNYNELFKINRDDNTFKSSIVNITLAIDSSPHELQYYAMRAKFYMNINNYEKAKKDIDNIRDKTNLLTGIPKIFVKNIVNDFDTKYNK